MSQTVKTETSAHKLVLWYQQHQRKLPWRKTADPYAIWVSETMLQQTRVEAVIPYFESFMQAYPDVAALAAAELQDVLKLWQGLGYYSRARNLHKAAQVVMSEYGGRIPDELEAFRALPGVGPYTAGAVFSIAHNQPVPAVDGNVLRVMARFLGIHEPVERAGVRRQITDVVADWLHQEEPRLLTQALMELGALVCTPRTANCDACPLQPACRAYATSAVDQLPVRKEKAVRKTVDIVAIWWEMDGEVWMEQRPDSGLLAGMWQLPAWEVDPVHHSGNDAEEADRLRQAVALQFVKWVSESRGGLQVRETELPDFAEIAVEKHVFSHLEWHVHVFRPIAPHPGLVPLPDGRKVRIPRDQLKALPLPRVYEKLFQYIYGSDGL
jgi:A/G-specific adenine glycosylase